MSFIEELKKAVEILNQTVRLHKAGVRYPIPGYLNYEAPFPPKYKELEQMRDEGNRHCMKR